jgi:cellobiose-specific phosphotransferase system component IIA
MNKQNDDIEKKLSKLEALEDCIKTIITDSDQCKIEILSTLEEKRDEEMANIEKKYKESVKSVEEAFLYNQKTIDSERNNLKNIKLKLQEIHETNSSKLLETKDTLIKNFELQTQNCVPSGTIRAPMEPILLNCSLNCIRFLLG